MPHHNRIHFSLICCIAAFVGCAGNPQGAPSASPGGGGAVAERNEGYSLLYKLMDDESDVGKIFILKGADDSVKKPVQQVAAVCQAAKKQLEGFRSGDPTVVLNTPGLPAVEKESRELATQEKTKLLLFSSGKTFELQLVFSQAQAMGYARDLAEALAKREDDKQRKAALNQLSQKFSDLDDAMMNLLTVK